MNLVNTNVTMTSLELVEFINVSRVSGDSELRHDHFMTKVPQVLGQDNAPKFLGTQTYIRQSNAYTNYDEIVKLVKQKLA
jgi:hypothetical protein